MPKNPKLEYDSNIPAFLQKLRGEYGDTSGRLERPIERARNPKQTKDEDDDEPVYIDEESNAVISKEDYKALVEGDTPGQTEGSSSTGQAGTNTSDPAKQSNKSQIGAQRKRKQIKVVGEEDNTESKLKPNTPAARKPKKGKKIKLSFDEE
ncbi:hypothetical protein N7495_005942 [Penicillium taxi]|uniref:uncharacterized protein n=1 Tax=Penicillium taxi TaxID=168475 RepID=UPI002544E126|nr:uncharacterized protein N7495_005942 [Penicillium taxi]KAJ5894251.1 hypothetical protein N7495_005942 [Penicillium taxi]